jgi:hypothetical protein
VAPQDSRAYSFVRVRDLPHHTAPLHCTEIALHCTQCTCESARLSAQRHRCIAPHPQHSTAQRLNTAKAMSAQTQQAQLTDDQWLQLHRDQLVKQNVPAAVHAIIAKKMNHEVFDSAATFALEDHTTRVVKATQKHGDAWIADHALVFRAPTDAKAALAQYPGLAERFATMARCKPEDALDKAVWRYAQALPGARPPVWCVEDEIGNGFMRGSPVSIGTAHVTCRRTGDTFALYWPEGDLDVGSAPRRDPHPHIKPGLRRDALLAASTDSSERWRAAYAAFATQASASADVPASSFTRPPATTPLKVWTDVVWTSEVTDPRFIFVEDVSEADAVFAHSGGAKYQVHHWQLVSWFAYEAALIKKDHLASTLRRAGLAHLAPVTFDLETELDALLGFLAATDVCAGAETRLGLRVGGSHDTTPSRWGFLVTDAWRFRASTSTPSTQHLQHRRLTGCLHAGPRHPEALRPRAVDRPQRDQVCAADPRVCRGGRLRGPALRRKAARAADGF